MSYPNAKILLIEDDGQTRNILKCCITRWGWHIREAESGMDGLSQMDEWNPDLILLDLGLPDIDGITFIERIRPVKETPILVISARIEERDKILALNAGADDFLSKPFGTGELEARIHALLRRVSRHHDYPRQNSLIRLDHLLIDLKLRRIFKNGFEVHLTPIEYRLLTLLLAHAGVVLTHRKILHEIWGPEHVDDLHYLRIYMRQLRHKIESDPARPKYLSTEVGVGYRWVWDHRVRSNLL